VEILFIDHDGVQVDHDDYRPSTALAGAMVDERYALRSLCLLQAIYRPSDAIVREGDLLLCSALRRSYRATRAAMDRDPNLKRMFTPRCRRRLRDWEVLAHQFLRARRAGRVDDAWRERARRRLRAAGYPQARAADWVAALETFAGFLERYAPLYAPVRG
jgi:hypothetical protein